MFRFVLLVVLIPKATALRCMQCNSDSYEKCKEIQQITECKESDDMCYSLTYMSKKAVHGSGAINQGLKRGCSNKKKRCNECDFYKFVMEKDCKIKCCEGDYYNVKLSKTVVFPNKKKRSSSETSYNSSSFQIERLTVIVTTLLTASFSLVLSR